jgi:hypothetical protein
MAAISGGTHSAGLGLRTCSQARMCFLPARRLAADGLRAWAEVVERGYEGLIAKDPASPYRGGRTLAWLKVKVLGVPRARARGWETNRRDRG